VELNHGKINSARFGDLKWRYFPLLLLVYQLFMYFFKQRVTAINWGLDMLKMKPVWLKNAP
jgi:hypothetical protein